jgi:ABC-type transporter Mla maintaining outer membrane lipid asymmetry ATPase subunit MlaF
MLSVFQGSSLFGQLTVLDNYQNDIEVCKSIYRKELSVWNGQFEVDGELVR